MTSPMTSTRQGKKYGRRQYSWRVRLRKDGSLSRRILVEALTQALLAGDPRTILRNKLRVKGDELGIGTLSLKLSEFRRIMVIGGGKATAGMALETEKILDGRITGGSVNIPAYAKPWPKSKLIRFNPASHPIPSEDGVRGVKSMLRLVGQPSEEDLVICLISGGGSALMPLPSTGLLLSDKQKTTNLLLKSGAKIDEINAVRKHLSDFKGGRLAERLYPATVVSLIISDVVGDRLESIASGPTVPDDTTYADVYRILQERELWRRVPSSVRKHIRKGKEGKTPETPKRGSRSFKRIHNVLVGTNKESCEAAAEMLKKRAYHSLILSTRLHGEAREAGKILAGICIGIRENQLPVAPPAAVVAGGETTVTIHGTGHGGRNQELVLSAASSIPGEYEILVSSIGTDGVDGPTDVAGAVADGNTVGRGLRIHMDPDTYLRENDSYSFFERLHDLVTTGPTGTNVNDIFIALIGPGSKKNGTTRRSRGR